MARCLEIEVASQGETIDDALANLREALELYFEDGDITAEVVHPLVTPIEIRIRRESGLAADFRSGSHSRT